MTRNFDCEFVSQMAANIDANVLPVLESTNDVLPDLSSLDRSLYTAVMLPMAAAYTVATATVTECMSGAAECFREMRTALDGCVQDMQAADEACATEFGGN